MREISNIGNGKKFRVLIATRNEVFDPWIGTIKTSLPKNDFDVQQMYFSSTHIFESKFKPIFRDKLKKMMRAHINFLGIANTEGAPYLYASDWNKRLGILASRSLIGNKILQSHLIRRLNQILIIVYRLVCKNYSLEIDLKLRSLESKPDLCVVMPTNMQGSYEHEVIPWSRKNNVLTLIPIMTLDNLTSKGFLLDLPDVVACWNEIQRQYLIKHHRVPKSRILLSNSLYYSAWQSKVPQFIRGTTNSNSIRFLYVCSSSRIGGYRHSTNDRTEETKTLCKLVAHLESHLNINGLEGSIKIRSHPTFPIDPLINKLRTERLHVEISNGQFPDFYSEEESLISDLNDTHYCFGMNTSALLQAALMGVKTICLKTGSNSVVTTSTPHLQQLISQGIVFPWDLDKELFSSISNVLNNTFQAKAKTFVGNEQDELVHQIYKLLKTKLV